MYQVRPEMIPALDAAEFAMFSKLLYEWQRHLGPNARNMRYYTARAGIKDLGIAIPPQLLSVEVCVGWPAKAVDALAARSVLEGLEGDPAAAELAMGAGGQGAWLPDLYDMALASSLVSGCCFLTVSAGAEGEAPAMVNAYGAHEAAALWDWRRKRISCGMAVVDADGQPGEQRTPTWVNLYTDRYTAQCRRSANGRWLVDRVPNPMGRPMMEPLVFSPTLAQPLGRSRITRAVRSITDKAVRASLRTEVAAEFFTSPQKYLLGADEGTFGTDEAQARAAKLKAYLGSIFAVTPNENGDIPQFGQLAQMSMEPHIALMQEYAKEFAAETGVPLHSLGIVQDNPASAEAMHAATEDVVSIAERMNRANGRALSLVARMCVAAATGSPMASAPVLTPVFANPSRPSMASRADFALKVASVVPTYAGTARFWRDLGYDDAEARARAAEVAAAQPAVAAQLADAMQPQVQLLST